MVFCSGDIPMLELIVLCVLAVCAVTTTGAMLYFGNRATMIESPCPPVVTHSYTDWATSNNPPCPIAPRAADQYVDAWYRAAHELNYVHRNLPAAHKVSADKAMGDLVRALRAFVPSEYLTTTAAILNAEHRRKTEKK